MKIYVAGGSSERELVAEYIEELEEAGHTITFNWTKSEGYVRVFSVEENLEAAKADFDAVASADVLWYMAPEVRSEGSHFELGVAVALRKALFVSGPYYATTVGREQGRVVAGRIFPLLTEERFETHDKALEAILRFGDHLEALRQGCEAAAESLGLRRGTDGEASVIRDQPPPVKNEQPAVWDLVIKDVRRLVLGHGLGVEELLLADMRERARLGEERYGTRLQAFNGRDALVDAYQELLDASVYLKQAEVEDEAMADVALFGLRGLLKEVLVNAYELRAMISARTGK